MLRRYEEKFVEKPLLLFSYQISEAYNNLCFCSSLQPFQFGITRTQRKSAHIPTRVSIQPTAVVISLNIYEWLYHISPKFSLCAVVQVRSFKPTFQGPTSPLKLLHLYCGFYFMLSSLASVTHRSLSLLHRLEELDLGNNELYNLVSVAFVQSEE